MSYKCQICDYSTNIKYNFKRHLESKKHIKKKEDYDTNEKNEENELLWTPLDSPGLQILKNREKSLNIFVNIAIMNLQEVPISLNI